MQLSNVPLVFIFSVKSTSGVGGDVCSYTYMLHLGKPITNIIDDLVVGGCGEKKYKLFILDMPLIQSTVCVQCAF